MSKFTPEYVQDYIAIRELSALYCLYGDAADGENYAQLYTEDGRFCPPDREYKGREELAKVCSTAVGVVHITADPIIEIDGDDAHQRSRLINVYRSPDKSTNEFVATGTYIDHLVRTPDGWRIKERRVELDLAIEPFWKGMRLLDNREWQDLH